MTAPDAPILIMPDINEVTSILIKTGICDDQNFSIVKDSGGVWDVVFKGAEYVSIALGEIEYSKLYAELSDKRSYNVEFIDGGLIQLMYRFDGETLLQHRLAFYPSPTLRPFRDDEDAYMADELYLEIVNRRIVPFPIRFDFDGREGVHVDVEHPRSHLTLGDVKNCRIPVSAPMTPRWFIEFVMRNFYRTPKRDFVGDLPHHRGRFSSTITANEESMIHLSVPALEGVDVIGGGAHG